MKVSELNANLIDSYLRLFEGAPPTVRRRLTARLMRLVRYTRRKPDTKAIDDLYGSFKGRQTADEILKQIHDARTFKTHLEGL